PNSHYQAIKDGEKAAANNWIYDGYKMTIFSDPEERVFESSLEGKKLKFYPAMAMERAGGNMAFASEWQPNVVVDRELITGQNPFSDKLLAEKLLEMLAK
ncbi:MAG: type 1 glutamine amidotransferase domain-containing protein, partial [Pseudomonadota bacterium]|nr:type 1 glutamine amidotransferase domain-containing protein [Pseudomonadota bacterium]